MLQDNYTFTFVYSVNNLSKVWGQYIFIVARQGRIY